MDCPYKVDAILRSLASGKLPDGSIFEPVSFSRMKGELDALLPAEMAPWVLHDLRRTCASGMAALGVHIETVEKVLNHASGSFRGIVGLYQKYDFASEKRAALDLWGAHVAALPAPFPAGIEELIFKYQGRHIWVTHRRHIAFSPRPFRKHWVT
jgi:hypothetical protein